jgi:hypothetical protein
MGLYDRGYYQSDQDLDLRPGWNQQSAVSQLIILNVIVFVVNLLFGNVSTGNQGTVNDALALQADTLWKPWTWYKTLTYAFAHSSRDISHIFFNMLSLYFMGRSVEMRYGRREFLKIYFLAALFCGVVTMVVRGDFVHLDALCLQFPQRHGLLHRLSDAGLGPGRDLRSDQLLFEPWDRSGLRCPPAWDPICHPVLFSRLEFLEVAGSNAGCRLNPAMVEASQV